MSGASRSFGAALAAAAVVWICSAGSALALDLVVDTFGDSASPGFQACTAAPGDCTLRGAIIKANSVAGPHTITLSANTYTLTIQGQLEDAAATGDLDIAQTITINGVSPASTVITWDETIPAANRDRIFHVLTSGNLTIRDVSLRQGATTGFTGAFAGKGGAILALGPLTVERASIRVNQAFFSGGGLWLQGPTVIRNSAINNNNAGDAAGIMVDMASGIPTIPSVLIESSTISTNTADVGGGLKLDAPNANAVVTLNSVTVANNSATAAGGLVRNNGTLFLRNTIVANNTASSSNPNCSGTISSQGNNLVWGGDTCGMSAGNNDIVNTVDPQFTPLQDNGGPTATHALGIFSGALDRGNPATPGSGGSACPATDQRGLTRAIDGDADGVTRCDIGAVEGGIWFAVNTTTDSNDPTFRNCNPSVTPYNCSLRGAITLANSSGIGVSYTITLPAAGAGSPYRLTQTGAGEDGNATGDLDVYHNVLVIGGGATTTVIDGNGADRVFHVLSSTGGFDGLHLQDVTIQNGNAGGGVGGGIFAQEKISLLRVRIRANLAASGGGIQIGDASTTLQLRASIFDSTIDNNNGSGTGAGGGIYQRAPSTVTLVNTTVAGNQAATGGGVFQSTASGTFALILANVTLAGNSAVTTGGIEVGRTATFRNTIVAGNTASATNPNCRGTGTFTSGGFNLVYGGNSCGMTNGVNGDIVNTGDPRLGPLQMNGGPTETMALGSGSAAIDAGNTAPPGSGGTACGATDQRGLPRPVDGDGVNGARCDIGAHEATTCTTHPRVDVQTQKIGPGQIRATISASLGALVQLRLGQPRPLQNAVVNVQGGPQNITTAQDVTVSGAQVVITVTRQGAPGTAVTVPFQVVDGCTAASPWNSFVGFGSGV